MAGGYYAYVRNMMEMFPPDPNGSIEPLDVIRDTLLQCESIDEARITLLSCESKVSGWIKYFYYIKIHHLKLLIE